MKNKLITIGLALLVGTACTRGFEEANIDPNQPAVVTTNILLSSAQETLLDQVYGGFDNQRVGMTLAQYWSQNQYTDESRYLYREATNNTTWNTMYTGINNLQEIIRINEASTVARNENQIAVARIMKAWAFQYLTDMYGDIPYFEALQATNNVSSPAYTPQQEIYMDLLKELTEANAQIAGSTGFASGDLIYGGDMTKWKKFANSLKMRVAIRMADRMPTQALAAIQEANTAGVFSSNADNAAIRYTVSQPNTNPLYVDVIVPGRIDYSSSDVLLNQLLQRNDPRLPAYFEPAVRVPANSPSPFIGRPFGQNAVNANALDPDNVSQLSRVVLSPDFPGMLMDYAEVNFILAEAAQRGASVGVSADSLYNNGIRASINYWDTQRRRVVSTAPAVTEAQITAYITANPYDPANWKQSIGVQKWIALYMQGFQGWFEWRRLDFTGVLKMPVDNPLIDIAQIPVRRIYPPDEQTLNGANYRAAVQQQGPDAFTTKVWWDVN
jgi:hypothetical protein